MACSTTERVIMNANGWTVIYIDGVARLGQRAGNTLYIDSEELMAIRCAAISLPASSWVWLLERKGAVRTSGHSISMLPPRQEQPVSAAERPEPRRPSLAAKILNVIKEHYK